MMEHIYRIFHRPTKKQQPPITEKRPSTGTVFRITGIPLGATVDDLDSVLSSEYQSENITLDTKQTTICPSCYSKRFQTALVQFTPHSPRVLEELSSGETHQVWFDSNIITVDKELYGLTQLYPTRGEIRADIIAVCGLNGHAYGSWRGRGNIKNMWLQHFLSQDFPDCRTMIYGYNSKLSTSLDTHMIPDYTQTFLDEVMKARRSRQNSVFPEKRRPIIFIGHSFGGIIIAQSLVKAKENDEIYSSLFQNTYATIFFGTPHRGLVVDDILAMLEEGSPRRDLVKSIEAGSMQLEGELRRFINYSSNFRILTFKETKQTPGLVKGKDGTWSRSGTPFIAVEPSSSVLQLPIASEHVLSAEGDHSTMVKFDHIGNSAYTSVVINVKQYLSEVSTATRPARYTNTDSKPNTMTTGGLVSSGYTELHIAVQRGNKKQVEVLLNKGADVDGRDTDGNTALHIATMRGYHDVVETLLDNGADIMIPTGRDRYTALHLAARDGKESVAEVLLNRGASITALDGYGYTALHFAAREGRENIVDLFLARGAAMNLRGCTELHLVAQDGHYRGVEIFLRKDVDIEAKNFQGYTALHLAAMKWHTRTVEILLMGGAKTTTVTSRENFTALHLAAKEGNEVIVGMLLRSNANVSAKDIHGNTAIRLANLKGHGKVVDLLIENGADIEGKEG